MEPLVVSLAEDPPLGSIQGSSGGADKLRWRTRLAWGLFLSKWRPPPPFPRLRSLQILPPSLSLIRPAGTLHCLLLPLHPAFK